jgi:holo-[acyl-carrier protein] synthase
MALVAGNGVDTVPIGRVARLLVDHAADLGRIFAPAERAHCERNPRQRNARYAAAFSAKEAVMKALGVGWDNGIEWPDIDTCTVGAGGGVTLAGGVQRLAAARGIACVLVSTAVAGGVAIAVAVAGRTAEGAGRAPAAVREPYAADGA